MPTKLSGKKIKVLRTNNDKEYVNKNLQHLCEYNGIQMKHYVAYMLQQNGVAKRKNIILKEMDTCMSKAKYLSHKLWDEAINCDA